MDRTSGAAAARLLGRVLEDPQLLDQLNADGVRPVDLGGAELQASYALLRHLREGGRLAAPTGPDLAARIDAAAVNLRVVGDWMLARRQDQARRAPNPRGEGVFAPTDTDLLVDAAARINVVWWVDLWGRAWPPAPELGQDVARLRRARALDALVALGTRLTQRASAGVAEPRDLVTDMLARLDRVDPTAIARYLGGRTPAAGNSHGRVAATTGPYPDSVVTVTTAPECGASSTYPEPR